MSWPHAARMAAGVTTAALVGYLLSYKRHVSRSLESADKLSAEPSVAGRVMGHALDRLVVRDGLQQASFYFIWKTLTRSRRHKLFFAAYVAVGCALVFEGLAVLVARGINSWMYHPIPELLSAPLILVLLYSMRDAACLRGSRGIARQLAVSRLGSRRGPAMPGGCQESHGSVGVVPLLHSAAAAACLSMGLADGAAPHAYSARCFTGY